MLERSEDDGFSQALATRLIDADRSTGPASDEEIFGTFFIGDDEFALPADRVREVVPYPDRVTPLPKANAAVRGIFGLRGEVLPSVDACTLLGLDAAEASHDLRLAVVSANGGHLGVLFDRTGEVVRVTPSQLVPLNVAENGSRVVDGVIALDEAERDHLTEKLQREKRNVKISVTRFKGLGEMNAKDLKETTMHPATRRLIRVTLDEFEPGDTGRLVERLMGKKPELRFQYIQENARFVEELDV